MPKGEKFNTDERLREARTRVLGQAVPVPLHERIEALCDAVYEDGHERPTKLKMLSALILAAPTNPATLDELLRDYDRASVGDALVGEEKVSDNVVKFPKRKPGPRRRGP